MDIDECGALGYLRLPQVLRLIPVSKSTWFRGIKAGKYPAPVKIGVRASGWRVVDVRRCMADLDAGQAVEVICPPLHHPAASR